MRSDLITLEEAKTHLRVPGDRLNADVQAKLDAAIDVIFKYLERRDVAWNAAMEAWDADTVPRSIKHAILIQLGEFDQDRGDDAQLRLPDKSPDQLSATVMALLKRWRDPALA